MVAPVGDHGFGTMIRLAFGQDNPNASLYVVLIGGVCLILAAICVSFVHDVGGERDRAAARAAGAKEAVPA